MESVPKPVYSTKHFSMVKSLCREMFVTKGPAVVQPVKIKNVKSKNSFCMFPPFKTKTTYKKWLELTTIDRIAPRIWQSLIP